MSHVLSQPSWWPLALCCGGLALAAVPLTAAAHDCTTDGTCSSNVSVKDTNGGKCSYKWADKKFDVKPGKVPRLQWVLTDSKFAWKPDAGVMVNPAHNPAEDLVDGKLGANDQTYQWTMIHKVSRTFTLTLKIRRVSDGKACDQEGADTYEIALQ